MIQLGPEKKKKKKKLTYSTCESETKDSECY